MAKMTLARIRKTAYPFPVYEAHFADGEVVRMSFWSQAGKPWDFDIGRQVCEHWRETMDRMHQHAKPGKDVTLYGRELGGANTIAVVAMSPERFPVEPPKAVAGYVYQDGRLVADDPHFNGGVVAVARKRVTAAQLKTHLADLAAQLESGVDPLQCAQAARELLAA